MSQGTGDHIICDCAPTANNTRMSFCHCTARSCPCSGCKGARKARGVREVQENAA